MQPFVDRREAGRKRTLTQRQRCGQRGRDQRDGKRYRRRAQHRNASQSRRQSGLGCGIDEERDDDSPLRRRFLDRTPGAARQQDADRVDVDEAGDGRRRIDTRVAEVLLQCSSRNEQYREQCAECERRAQLERIRELDVGFSVRAAFPEQDTSQRHERNDREDEESRPQAGK